jgi:hypothetical protein
VTPTTTSRALPRFSAVLALALVAACAQPPPVTAKRTAEEPQEPATVGALPATYVSQSGCPGCLVATITLRPDSSYLLRDQLGASEFYDFGRWRLTNGTLELAGDRDKRTYPLANLRRAVQVETLRGPFRMVGLYDGARFKECLTGISWGFAETRAAETLRQEFKKQSGPALVSLDAQIEGSPETLRVLRPATLHNARACP